MRALWRASVALAIGSTALLFAPQAWAAEQTASCATAQSASALGSTVQTTIGSAGDVDAFRVSVPAKQWVSVTLTGLPTNLGFDVRTTSNSLLATGSSATGTGFERTFVKLPAGTYCVRVFGVSGTWSSRPYTLRTRALGNGMTLLNYSVGLSNDYFRFVGEVFNGTSQPRDSIRLQVARRNGAGTVVSYDTLYPPAGAAVQPGGTVAFEDSTYYDGASNIGFPTPPVGDVSTCTLGASGMRIAGLANVRQYGTHTASGVVINDSTTRYVRFYLNQYDSNGIVVDSANSGYSWVPSLDTHLFFVATPAHARATRWLSPLVQEC